MRIDAGPTGGVTPEGLANLAAKHPQWAVVVNEAGKFAQKISDVNQAIASTNYTNARLVYENELKVAGEEVERNVAAQAVSKNWDDETYAKELDNAYAQARKTAAEQTNKQFGAGTFSDKGEYIKDKSFAMNEANLRSGEDAAYAVKKNKAIFDYKVNRLKTQTAMGLATTAQNYDNFGQLGDVAGKVVEQNGFLSPVERVTGVTNAMTQSLSRQVANGRAVLAEYAYGANFESSFSAALAAGDYQKAARTRDDSLKKVRVYYTRERQKAEECYGSQLVTIRTAHKNGNLSDTEKEFLEATLKDEYKEALRDSAAAEKKDVKAVYNEEVRMRQLRNAEVRAALQEAREKKTLTEDDTAANILNALNDQRVPTIREVYNGRYKDRFEGMTPEQLAKEESRIEKKVAALFGRDWSTRTPESLTVTALLAQKSLDDKDPRFYEKTVLYYDLTKFALGRVNLVDDNGRVVKKGSSYIDYLSKAYKENATRKPKYDTKQAEVSLKGYILQKEDVSTFKELADDDQARSAAVESWLLQRIQLIGEAQDEKEAQMLIKQSKDDYDKFRASAALLLQNKLQLSGDGYVDFMTGVVDEALTPVKETSTVEDGVNARKYVEVELNALKGGATVEEAKEQALNAYYSDKYKELTGNDIPKSVQYAQQVVQANPAAAAAQFLGLVSPRTESVTITSPKEIYVREVEMRNKAKLTEEEEARKAVERERKRKHEELIRKIKQDSEAYAQLYYAVNRDDYDELLRKYTAYLKRTPDGKRKARIAELEAKLKD